jgi:NTP pyrophosphatase (non-canonical NTP hydrolase)
MNLHDFYALYKKWFNKKEDNKELKEPTYQENKDELFRYQRGFRKRNGYRDQEIADLLSQIVEISELHDENGDLKLEYKMDKEKLKQEHERIKNKYK